MLRRSLFILAVILAVAMIESSNAKSSSRRYHMKYFKREFEPENYEAARERLRADLYRKLLEALSNERINANDYEDTNEEHVVLPDHGESNSEDTSNVSKRRFLKS